MTFTLSENSITDAFKNDESIAHTSKQISNDIINGKYSIVNFIENLGFALTSKTVELRVKGIKLLSNTLSNLPNDYLNEQQLNFIVTFYCDRLNDHHNVIPAVLDGILILSKMKYLPNGSSEKMFRCFIQNTTCQSQIREDRYKFYLFLETICDKHYEELKEMKADFINGVINSIDGERDPRNLLFLFTFMPNFIKKFPLHNLSEELFETFACYFPIDFQPIKNDQNSITREQLSDKLINCLVASEEFMECTVPLLNEKLGSDLITAKLDSLELLRRSAENFPEYKFDIHFDNIWNTLKPEIFPGSDNIDVYNAGLIALKSILNNAFNCQEISEKIQSKILSTILIHLSDDANHRLFEPASKIALICIETNQIYASEKILNILLIKLKQNSSKEYSINIADNNDHQIIINNDDFTMGSNNDIKNLQEIEEENLKILTLITKIFSILNRTKQFSKINLDLCKEFEIELMKFLNKINIKKNNNYYINDNYIKIIINCITESISILTNSNRIQFYKIFQNILCDTNNTIDIKIQIIKIYKYDKNELKIYLINEILNNFNIYSSEIKYKIYKNFIILINPIDNLHDNELEKIIFDLIINNIFINVKELTIYDDKEQIIALNALKEILINESENRKNNDRIIKKLYNEYNLIEKFINYVRENNSNTKMITTTTMMTTTTTTTTTTTNNDMNNIDVVIKENQLLLSDNLLEIISKILCLFMKQFDKNEQIIILNKYMNKNNDNNNILINILNESDLYIINGLIGNVHENVIQNMNYDLLKSLINNLIKLSLKYVQKLKNNDISDNDDDDDNNNYYYIENVSKKQLRKICHHLLCSIFNKYDGNNNKQINEQLISILYELNEIIKLEIYNNLNKYGIEILAWIIKGLLVQGHSQAYDLIESILFDLLTNHKENFMNYTCYAFEIISYELPELHLPVIKYLYKQKFFQFVLHKIWDKLKEYSIYHINAFVFVIKMTPHNILKMHLDKISLVLFKCLDTKIIQNVSNVQISLEIIKKFLIEKDDYFRNHLNHLIPELLILTKNQFSMKIRISAIECLEALTEYSKFIIQPYKTDVIFGLISALDDRKRLVRNAAVKARNLWFLI